MPTVKNLCASDCSDDKGFVVVNEYQQSPAHANIFAVGVAVSIPQTIKTPIPIGIPKTGYLIESQGTAAVQNINSIMTSKSEVPSLHSRALFNALCITDFGYDGAVFLTVPQIPPRSHDFMIQSPMATLAKIAFEKYFLHKVESGDTDPYYEKYMLKLIGLERTTKDSNEKQVAKSI